MHTYQAPTVLTQCTLTRHPLCSRGALLPGTHCAHAVHTYQAPTVLTRCTLTRHPLCSRGALLPGTHCAHVVHTYQAPTVLTRCTLTRHPLCSRVSALTTFKQGRQTINLIKCSWSKCLQWKSAGGHITPASPCLPGRDLILMWKITFLSAAHWEHLHVGSGAWG